MTTLPPVQEIPYVRCPHCKDEHPVGLDKCPHCRFRYNDQTNFARLRLVVLILCCGLLLMQDGGVYSAKIVLASLTAIALSYVYQHRHPPILEALRKWPSSAFFSWSLSYLVGLVSFVAMSILENPWVVFAGALTLTATQTFHILSVSPARQMLPRPAPAKPGEAYVACTNCGHAMPESTHICVSCGHVHQMRFRLAQLRLVFLLVVLITAVYAFTTASMMPVAMITFISLLCTFAIRPKGSLLETVSNNGALVVTTWVASATLFMFAANASGPTETVILGFLLGVSQYFHVASFIDRPREKASPPQIAP